jgi:hypothetical protein
MIATLKPELSTPPRPEDPDSWGAIRPCILAVHTSTATGEAMVNMIATFAQFERRLIGQRTREALAVKKASGVRLGRPPTVPQDVVRRIQRQRARGDSLRAIAASLNREGVPTGKGGAEWYAATVRGILPGRPPDQSPRATPPVRPANRPGPALVRVGQSSRKPIFNVAW